MLSLSFLYIKLHTNRCGIIIRGKAVHEHHPKRTRNLSSELTWRARSYELEVLGRATMTLAQYASGAREEALVALKTTIWSRQAPQARSSTLDRSNEDRCLLWSIYY